MSQKPSYPAFLLAAIFLVFLSPIPRAAEENTQGSLPSPAPESADPAILRLTLEEAKERALSASKLLNLASMNAQAKAYAIKAARADYFPKVIGGVLYLHFNDQLGKVLTTQGRSLNLPSGVPLITFPPTTVQAAVFQQNSTFTTVNVLQPITDLLKVRQGVKIAQADEQIAQAELERRTRELVSGVQQLYWGLLAARRSRSSGGSARSQHGSGNARSTHRSREERGRSGCHDGCG